MWNSHHMELVFPGKRIKKCLRRGRRCALCDFPPLCLCPVVLGDVALVGGPSGALPLVFVSDVLACPELAVVSCVCD